MPSNSEYSSDDVQPLQEVRYSLREMIRELPEDRKLLQIGGEIIGQDEITRVFNLKKGQDAEE